MSGTDVSSCLADIFSLKYFSGLHDGLDVERILIPDFQRPYCWSIADIQKLIDDVDEFRYQSDTHEYDAEVDYFFGSICFRVRENKLAEDQDSKESSDSKTSVTLEVLDGQQRLLSFLLLAHIVLKEANSLDDKPESGLTAIQNLMGLASSDALSPFALKLSVDQPESQRHIAEILQALRNGYEPLKELSDLDLYRDTVNLDLKRLRYFLEHGKVAVTLLRHGIREAEQFFQGENNRGKAMGMLDILKAYHTRYAIEGLDTQERQNLLKEFWPKKEETALVQKYVIPAMLVRFGLWIGDTDKPEYAEYLKGMPESPQKGRIVDVKRQGAADFGRIPDFADISSPGRPFFLALRHFCTISAALERILTAEKNLLTFGDAETYLHIALLLWLDRFLPCNSADFSENNILSLKPEDLRDRLNADREFQFYKHQFRVFLNRLRKIYDRIGYVTVLRCLGFYEFETDRNLLTIPYRSSGPAACRRLFAEAVSPDSSRMASCLRYDQERINNYRKEVLNGR